MKFPLPSSLRLPRIIPSIVIIITTGVGVCFCLYCIVQYVPTSTFPFLNLFSDLSQQNIDNFRRTCKIRRIFESGISRPHCPSYLSLLRPRYVQYNTPPFRGYPPHTHTERERGRQPKFQVARQTDSFTYSGTTAPRTGISCNPHMASTYIRHPPPRY